MSRPFPNWYTTRRGHSGGRNESGSEDGTDYLRASEQAINIFVEALDLEIEAAQIANEERAVRRQARRGLGDRTDGAVQAAWPWRSRALRTARCRW